MKNPKAVSHLGGLDFEFHSERDQPLSLNQLLGHVGHLGGNCDLCALID